MKALEWLAKALLIVVAGIPYLLVLAVIGAGVAMTALQFSASFDPSLASTNVSAQAPPALSKLAGYLVGPGATLVGIVLLGLKTPSLVYDEDAKAKVREAIDAGTEWIVKLAELILIAAVFQLAGQQVDSWLIRLLAFLIFACLTFHAVKPVNRYVYWPLLRRVPDKPWIGMILGGVVFVVELALAIFIVSVLSSALDGILKSGLASL